MGYIVQRLDNTLTSEFLFTTLDAPIMISKLVNEKHPSIFDSFGFSCVDALQPTSFIFAA